MIVNMDPGNRHDKDECDPELMKNVIYRLGRERQEPYDASLEPLPVDTVVGWKQLCNALTLCFDNELFTIKFINVTLNQLLAEAKSDRHILLPSESHVRGSQEYLKNCNYYKEFLNGITNLFMKLLLTKTGYSKAHVIFSVFDELLIKLHYGNQDIFLHLISNFVDFQKEILTTFSRASRTCMEIELSTFTVKDSHVLVQCRAPHQTFTPVQLTHKTSIPCLEFSTKVLCSMINYLNGTEVYQKALDVLYMKFAAIDGFGFKEVIECEMLKELPIKSYPKMVEILEFLLTKCLCDVNHFKQQIDLQTLEKQVIVEMLNNSYPLRQLDVLTVKRLQDIVMQSFLSKEIRDETSEMRIRLLSKIVSEHPRLLMLEAPQVKSLITEFIRTSSKISLSLLMAYMEAELRNSIPVLTAQETMMSNVTSDLPKRTIVKRFSTEECSLVWLILKKVFLNILNRLIYEKSRNKDEKDRTLQDIEFIKLSSCNPSRDLDMIHQIMQAITLVNCKLETSQQEKPNEIIHIGFNFLFTTPNELIVQPISVLPLLCLSASPDDQVKKWQMFLDIVNFIRQLPETWQQEQKELSQLEALSGLIWLHQDNKPPLLEDDLNWLLHLAERLQARLGLWKDRPGDIEENTFLIIKSFYNSIFNTKGHVTSWRAKILQKCLEYCNTSLQVMTIQSVPCVLTSCHKEHVAKLLNCFEELKNSTEKSVVLAVANTVPQVVCVLSGRCVLQKILNSGHVELKTVCCDCDASVAFQTRGWNHLNHWVDFTSRWKNFIQHKDGNVRRAMANGFNRYSTHLNLIERKTDVEIWLKLLEDDDASVGLTMASKLSDLFTHQVDTDSQLFDMVYELLKRLTWRYLTSSENSKQLRKIVLTILHCLSRQKNPCVAVTLAQFYSFLIAMGNESCFDVTATSVQHLAQVHETTTKALFWSIEPNIWNMLASTAQHFNIDIDFMDVLNKIVKTFGVDLVAAKRMVYRLIGIIIPKCIENRSYIQVLEKVGQNLRIPVPVMLEKWYPLIFTQICLEQEENVTRQCINFMVIRIKQNECAVVKLYVGLIVSSLMLSFNKHNSKVLTFVSHILKLVETREVTFNSNYTKEKIKSFFMGILVTVQDTVQNKYIRTESKIEALLSLARLCKYMGMINIRPYTHKILDVLCLFVDVINDEMVPAYCTLVLEFMSCLDEKHLKSVALALLANMMSFDWKKHQIHVKPILAIIAPGKGILKYFGPANEMVRYFGFMTALKNAEKFKNSLQPEQFLCLSLEAIAYPREKGKQVALKDLEEYVYENNEKVQEYLISSLHNPVTIRQIYERLLEVCTGPNASTRLSGIECLGHLGALDPNNSVAASGFQKSRILDVDPKDRTFIASSLELLAEELQSASTSAELDVIALVCQEFMKALDFGDEVEKAPVEVWSMLSERTQLLLIPFFKSSYVTHVQTDHEDVQCPIFGSNLGETFQSWLFYWVCTLIEMIRNEEIKNIFSSLKLLFKINSRCVEFFLPHIFKHALLSTAENYERNGIPSIIKELRAAGRFPYPDGIRIRQRPKFEPDELISETRCFPCSMHSFSNMDYYSDTTPLLLKSSQVVLTLINLMLKWKLERSEKLQKIFREEEEDKKRPRADKRFFLKEARVKDKLQLSNELEKIDAILGSLDLLKVTQRCHKCLDHFRAIGYLENYSDNNPDALQTVLPFFLRIYVQIRDEDGVLGILKLMDRNTTSTDQLLINTMRGHYGLSISFLENVDHELLKKPQIIENMIKCYLGLEKFNSALALIENHTFQNCEDNDVLLSAKLEVLWRKGEWAMLEQTLTSKIESGICRPTWAAHFATILVHMHKDDMESAKQAIAVFRDKLGLWLHESNFNGDLYSHYYSAFLFMHMLGEMDTIVKILERGRNISEENIEVWCERLEKTFKVMDLKQKRISKNWHDVHEVLTMRRTILSILQYHLGSKHQDIMKVINDYVALLWLQSAKLALSLRQFLQASLYANTATKLGCVEAFIVTAQIEYESNNKEYAVSLLELGISMHFPNCDSYRELASSVNTKGRMICSRARLLIAEYCTEMKTVNFLQTVRLFKDAVSVFMFNEETWVKVGRSWQNFNIDINEVYTDEKSLNILKEVMKNYSNALLCGVQHMYETLPAVITIWANAALAYYNHSVHKAAGSTDKACLHNYLKQFTETLSGVQKQAPVYVFYACMNYLTARLCHPVKVVYMTIQQLLVMIMEKYPHQCLWKLVPMLKVTHTLRVRRVQEVLDAFQSKNSDKVKLVTDYIKLIDCLYTLGFAQSKHSRDRTSISSLSPKLVSLLKQSTFSKIMMPCQDLLSIVFPSDNADFKNHNPFPRPLVYITGIKEEVIIIQSLQKPKKFVLSATDDKEYPWLVKIKDDLRIDNLVMDFMHVINSLIQNDPACNQRGLHCETYSVVPIGEDCGLIEWVPNIVPMRDTILDTYKMIGHKITLKKEIDKHMKPEVKLKLFQEEFITAHPSVLKRWFTQQFPADTARYEARQQFLYSVAVMSVVGYILGLGDRHGGNIMISTVNGKAIHVDFNCLFNKGEDLSWPEKVPFRLTHNMVGVLGITGVHGAFYVTCVQMLRLIRANMDSLLGVLRPIVYDAVRRDRLNDIVEVKSEFYNKTILSLQSRVRLRMSGYMSDQTNERNVIATDVPLSPEGQARAIIAAATDPKLLSQMYPGWGAFM